jgi:peptide/nickel transport system substrate-binding protein
VLGRKRIEQHLWPWARLLACALTLLALAAIASGCGSSTGTTAAAAPPETGPPQHGGNVVVGADQEPACLNVNIVCGSQGWTTSIYRLSFDSFLDTDPQGHYFPVLANEVPTVENGDVKTVDGRMVVRMPINPAAHWNDGVPITCDDLVFTWKTIMSDKWLVISKNGWDKIQSISCPDPKTTVTTFKEQYAPYLVILGSSPLPKHELQGKDFNDFWNARLTVGSGPFRFDHWSRHVELVMKRDPNYWNAGKDDKPFLDSVTFKFISDTNTLKIQLRTREVDLIFPPPDTSLSQELKTFPHTRFQVAPGGYWEQVAFNMQQKPLDELAVRQAISYSIDRDQITGTVMRHQVPILNSSLLPQVKQYYVPAWERYKADPAKVKEVLEKAGWKRDGQWWTKGGKPLTVHYVSTAGNALRMKVSQLMQQQLKKNGIEMTIDLQDPGVFFSQTTTHGAFGLAQWAWSSKADPSQVTLFSCDQIPTAKNHFQGQNNYRYCNRKATKLMNDVDRTVVIADRARQAHQLQGIMADDLPFLPIFQRPDTIAFNERVQGIVNNPLAGQTWNVEDWWVSK